MNGFAALSILVGLVIAATATGLLWRASTGRARTVRAAEVIAPAEVGVPALGDRATLLQLSTEFCSPCRSTARVLGAIAADVAGVRHVEVDVGGRPDLADRFRLLQTPTTLVLDGTGAVRARIGGAVHADDVRTTLDHIIGSDHATV